LLVSQGSKLKYEFNFEDEIYEVSSPATIFIPKNTLHSFKVISGKGIYICIIFQGRYQASK